MLQVVMKTFRVKKGAKVTPFLYGIPHPALVGAEWEILSRYVSPTPVYATDDWYFNSTDILPSSTRVYPVSTFYYVKLSHDTILNNTHVNAFTVSKEDVEEVMVPIKSQEEADDDLRSMGHDYFRF